MAQIEDIMADEAPLTQQEVKRIQVTVEEAEHMVETMRALQRLKDNDDFKKVIVKGYSIDNAVRATHMLGDPNMQDDDSRTQIIRQLDAIAMFQEHLRVVESRGNIALKTLNDYREIS